MCLVRNPPKSARRDSTRAFTNCADAGRSLPRDAHGSFGAGRRLQGVCIPKQEILESWGMEDDGRQARRCNYRGPEHTIPRDGFLGEGGQPGLVSIILPKREDLTRIPFLSWAVV